MGIADSTDTYGRHDWDLLTGFSNRIANGAMAVVATIDQWCCMTTFQGQRFCPTAIGFVSLWCGIRDLLTKQEEAVMTTRSGYIQQLHLVSQFLVDVRALNNVSLQIDRGVWSVGRSAPGKSVTAMLTMRLLFRRIIAIRNCWEDFAALAFVRGAARA